MSQGRKHFFFFFFLRTHIQSCIHIWIDTETGQFHVRMCVRKWEISSRMVLNQNVGNSCQIRVWIRIKCFRVTLRGQNGDFPLRTFFISNKKLCKEGDQFIEYQYDMTCQRLVNFWFLFKRFVLSLIIVSMAETQCMYFNWSQSLYYSLVVTLRGELPGVKNFITQNGLLRAVQRATSEHNIDVPPSRDKNILGQ